MTSLQKVLRLNAASCLGFGALFALVPGRVADVAGDAPVAVVAVLGVALIGNGMHLAVASQRRVSRRAEVIWFSIGDIVWWLGSLALVAAQVWVTTAIGAALTLVVATGVAAMGLAQVWLLGRARAGVSPAAYWRRIGASWRSLPLWVKVWLFALNGVFLGGLAFLPSDLSRVVLCAYVAAGPVLLAFAFLEGGLSRAMGLGHLIPWTPMLVWLLVWLGRPGLSGAEIAYGVVLVAATALCLAFDLYDLRRWAAGDRATLGTDQSPSLA